VKGVEEDFKSFVLAEESRGHEPQRLVRVQGWSRLVGVAMNAVRYD